MKTPRIILGAAALGGWMIASPALTAQDQDPKPDPAPTPRGHERSENWHQNNPGRSFHPQAMGNRPMWRMMQRPDHNPAKPEASADKQASPQSGPGPSANSRGMWMRHGKMGMMRGGMGMNPGMGMMRGGMGMNPGMGMMRGGMGMMGRGMGMMHRRMDMSPGGPTKDDAGQAPIAKARHLKQAAEHLRAAGLTDQAQKAEQEANRLKSEALRDKGPKPTPDMSAEVEKMRRELDDLRGQLRRLKADAAARHGNNPPTPPAPDTRESEH